MYNYVSKFINFLNMNDDSKILYQNHYLAFFDSGSITVSDGVGFVGSMLESEVKDLYVALDEYFNKKS